MDHAAYLRNPPWLTVRLQLNLLWMCTGAGRMLVVMTLNARFIKDLHMIEICAFFLFDECLIYIW